MQHRKEFQENAEACAAWETYLEGTPEVVTFKGRGHDHLYGYATGPTREAVEAEKPYLPLCEPTVLQRGAGWVMVYIGDNNYN